MTREECALCTQRLDLRPLELDDAQAIFDGIRSDPEVMKFERLIATHSTVSETSTFIRRAIHAFACDAGIPWAIRFRDKPEVIGTIDLRLDHSGGGEVGFAIARSYWRCGIATEALQAVVTFARNTLKLNTLFATCCGDHVQPAQVLKKVGFRIADTPSEYDTYPNLGLEPRITLKFERDLTASH
jgi:ribosomal-protein-alanine N-acetyltransferase